MKKKSLADFYDNFSLNTIDIDRFILGAGKVLVKMVVDYPLEFSAMGLLIPKEDAPELNDMKSESQIPQRGELVKWNEILVNDRQKEVYEFLKENNLIKEGNTVLFVNHKSSKMTKTVPQFFEVFNQESVKDNEIDIFASEEPIITYAILGWDYILGVEEK